MKSMKNERGFSDSWYFVQSIKVAVNVLLLKPWTQGNHKTDSTNDQNCWAQNGGGTQQFIYSGKFRSDGGICGEAQEATNLYGEVRGGQVQDAADEAKWKQGKHQIATSLVGRSVVQSQTDIYCKKVLRHTSGRVLHEEFAIDFRGFMHAVVHETEVSLIKYDCSNICSIILL